MKSSRNYSDEVLFGLQDTIARYSWTTYYIFIFLSSLIGDISILIASRNRAFKLNKFIVVVIEHVAVCDLAVTFSYVFVKIVTLIADKWLLGETCCILLAYVSYYFNEVSVLLICILTISKLLILKSRRQYKRFTSKQGHLLCGVVWVYSSTLPLIFYVVERSDNIIFDYRGYICSSKLSKNFWNWLAPLITAWFIAIPNLVVVVVTIVLLIHLFQAKRIALRTRRTLRWRGITSTLLVAVIHCISFFPYATFRIIESRSDDNQGEFLKAFPSLLR